jgi:hypothetical protein
MGNQQPTVILLPSKLSQRHTRVSFPLFTPISFKSNRVLVMAGDAVEPPQPDFSQIRQTAHRFTSEILKFENIPAVRNSDLILQILQAIEGLRNDIGGLRTEVAGRFERVEGQITGLRDEFAGFRFSLAAK